MTDQNFCLDPLNTSGPNYQQNGADEIQFA
jgi:hypothetical protein